MAKLVWKERECLVDGFMVVGARFADNLLYFEIYKKANSNRFFLYLYGATYHEHIKPKTVERGRFAGYGSLLGAKLAAEERLRELIAYIITDKKTGKRYIVGAYRHNSTAVEIKEEQK